MIKHDKTGSDNWNTGQQSLPRTARDLNALQRSQLESVPTWTQLRTSNSKTHSMSPSVTTVQLETFRQGIGRLLDLDVLSFFFYWSTNVGLSLVFLRGPSSSSASKDITGNKSTCRAPSLSRTWRQEQLKVKNENNKTHPNFSPLVLSLPNRCDRYVDFRIETSWRFGLYTRQTKSLSLIVLVLDAGK